MTQTIQVPTVWDARYTCDAAPLTSTTKQARVIAQAEREGLVQLLAPPRRRTDAIFRSIGHHHDTAYVAAVQTGTPRVLAESQWFTWSPAFAESVAQIWAGHQFALGLVANSPAGYPLVLHPVSGAHHARYDRGAGFCTFNYLVGPARRYLRGNLGERCAIIDLDAHFGDGTEELTRGEDDLFQLFDISASSETRLSRARTGLLAFEVKSGADYLLTLREFLPEWLDTVKPKFVQYLAGADPLASDPLGGVRGMGVKRLRERDAFVIAEVRKRRLPMVVTLAGGYVAGVTEEVHLNTIREMQAALAKET